MALCHCWPFPHALMQELYTTTSNCNSASSRNRFAPNHKSNDHRWYKQNSYLMFCHTPTSVDWPVHIPCYSSWRLLKICKACSQRCAALQALRQVLHKITSALRFLAVQAGAMRSRSKQSISMCDMCAANELFNWLCQITSSIILFVYFCFRVYRYIMIYNTFIYDMLMSKIWTCKYIYI